MRTSCARPLRHSRESGPTVAERPVPRNNYAPSLPSFPILQFIVQTSNTKSQISYTLITSTTVL